MVTQKDKYVNGAKYVVSLAGVVLLLALGGFSGYVIRRLDATVTHHELEQHSSTPHRGSAMQRDVQRLEARQIRIEDMIIDIRDRLKST